MNVDITEKCDVTADKSNLSLADTQNKARIRKCNIFSNKISLNTLGWIMNIFLYSEMFSDVITYTYNICRTFLVPYRKKLSNQHIRSFF